MNDQLPMQNHEFERNPTYPEECRRCGEAHDAGIHQGAARFDGPDEDDAPDFAEDWPPNVVAYLESAGIRNPPNT